MSLIEPSSHLELRQIITQRILADRRLLDTLHAKVRGLGNAIRHMQSSATTSITLVGADGGYNKLQYDSFFVQLVCVVASSNNEYCREASTPTMPIADIDRLQFDAAGRPITAELVAKRPISHPAVH